MKIAETAELWRYWLPSIRGEGWAYVVLGSDGFFASVSDYGNYAFWWTHIGSRTFKEFLLGIEPGYMQNKLNSQRVFDPEDTVIEVRRLICEERRRQKLTSEAAREAWEDAGSISSEYDLYRWVDEWSCHFESDCYGLGCFSPDPMVIGFVNHILPRLKAALREEFNAGSSACAKGA